MARDFYKAEATGRVTRQTHTEKKIERKRTFSLAGLLESFLETGHFDI